MVRQLRRTRVIAKRNRRTPTLLAPSGTLSMNLVAADVSPLHLKLQNYQSRLTSAATVQGFKARFHWGILSPPACGEGGARGQES